VIGSADPAGPVGPAPDEDVTRILFVCTANQCRSPFAEALARRRFAGRPFVIGSAGLLEGGRATPPAGLLVAAENGLDLSEHVSERVDTRRLSEWDLVLTMSRRHVRELVAADPGLWPRVFTVPQFVRWIVANPPGRHAILRTWLELVGADRARSDMIGSRAEDEIADPVDGPAEQWRELAATLTTDLETIAERLLPAVMPIRARSDAHPPRHAVAEGRAVEEPRTPPAGRRVHREGALDGATQLRGFRGAE
jgi:protein-tyrosine phosphatase